MVGGPYPLHRRCVFVATRYLLSVSCSEEIVLELIVVYNSGVRGIALPSLSVMRSV